MARFEEIAQAFQMVDRDMRLEMLLEYAEKLPPLPERYEELRDAGVNMVHECQSPVFLRVEVEDGITHLYADVPREAPTARAFTAIMVESFNNKPYEVVRDAPDDVLQRLRLANLLGMQRTRGLTAIYQRIKNEAVRQAKERSGAAG